MEEPSDSFIDTLRREPDRAVVLLRLAIAVPPAVALWSLLAPWTLPDLGVAAVTMLVVLAFGGVMAWLASSLTRHADRWQIQSAVEARRLLSRREAPREPERRAEDSSFHQTYFMLRLQDEVRAARRIGAPMTVVVLKISEPVAGGSQALIEQVNFDMARLSASHARTIRAPSAIGPLEFAFCVPEQDRGETKTLVRQILGALGDYWCAYGIAAYPEDASEASALLDIAREQAEGVLESASA